MWTMSQYGLGYSCCYCKEPIKDKDIPKEVLEKISMQLVGISKPSCECSDTACTVCPSAQAACTVW